MSALKTHIGRNVLEAARQRIGWVFDNVPRISVSFSGGKDSTVLTHLVMEEAIKRNRKVAMLFIDLEAQYRATIEHVCEVFTLYTDHIEPYWIALPIVLRNAVSQFEPRWVCWDPDAREKWVREPDPRSIADPARFPFYRHAMEFEEFVPAFGDWYAQGELSACFVGIRSDESLNRFRTLICHKRMLEGKRWTTWMGGFVFNAYPIYDWRTEDIWTYHASTAKPYNRLYDLMHGAGLTIHQMRICQPYGDDQRKGLYLYHVIEPETWGKVVARVSGANAGALYAQESGNILGRLKVSKPEGHTWESYAQLLLDSMPNKAREHYRDKIATFLHWWKVRGGIDPIPDEAALDEEAARKSPSWRRICKMLLRHDYWAKGLSFSQTKSEAYERYKRIMKNRRERWGIYA